MKLKQKPKHCGGWHGRECFKHKKCVVCNAVFKPTSGVNKFCTTECKGKWRYITGSMTTESQYKRISGNWVAYFRRMRQGGKHLGGRKHLTVKFLLGLLKKQETRCALSGVELTCTLEKGSTFFTNASLDRIDSDKGYEPSNVQLVCKVVNGFKRELTNQSFVWWCQQVVNNNRNSNA